MVICSYPNNFNCCWITKDIWECFCFKQILSFVFCLLYRLESLSMWLQRSLSMTMTKMMKTSKKMIHQIQEMMRSKSQVKSPINKVRQRKREPSQKANRLKQRELLEGRDKILTDCLKLRLMSAGRVMIPIIKIS